MLDEKEHPKFKRVNDDLVYKCDIDLLTALAGGSVYVPHLDDRLLHVTVLPGEVIRPGMSIMSGCGVKTNSLHYTYLLIPTLTPTAEVKMISGEGMPVYKRSHENGNLFIEFNVIFPAANWTTPDKIAALEHILPARPRAPALGGKVVDEYSLENVDPTRGPGGGGRRRGGQHEDHMDEDGGGPSVQCAQQ